MWEIQDKAENVRRESKAIAFSLSRRTFTFLGSYLLNTIENASPKDERFSPNRVLMCLVDFKSNRHSKRDFLYFARIPSILHSPDLNLLVTPQCPSRSLPSRVLLLLFLACGWFHRWKLYWRKSKYMRYNMSQTWFPKGKVSHSSHSFSPFLSVLVHVHSLLSCASYS